MESFESLYAILEPTVVEAEKQRKKLKAKGVQNGFIWGAVVFCLGCIFLTMAEYPFEATFIISLGCFGLLLLCCINYQSQILNSFYKQQLISRIVSEMVESAEFIPEEGISADNFERMQLFCSPDRFASEDMIKGRVDKTNFICSEVLAEERHTSTDSKGKTSEYWTDIFRGVVFIADFHKDFNGITTVGRGSIFKFCIGKKRVKLENVDFEKRFDVYSSDPLEARYLLSPSMMERLIELDNRFKGEVVISFVDSNICIAIPDRNNHFEASVWRSITPQSLKSEFEMIYALISIVNELNLNTRIWSKQ